jgi:hypothetical protein
MTPILAIVLGGIINDAMLFFFLSVLFWLWAWAGSTAFVRLPNPAPFTSVWNKACAIACFITCLIAIILLIFGPPRTL